MSDLVQIEAGAGAAKSNRRRAVLVHACRLMLLLGVVLCLRANHARLFNINVPTSIVFDRERLKDVLPEADHLADGVNTFGARNVVDVEGNVVGSLMQTSPDSDPVVGFSGSTNLWVVFGAEQRIVALKIVASGDTREHLRDVQRDPSFLASLNGLTPSEALAAGGHVDSVSGATLTSLAIMEGVLRRLEREQGSGSPQVKAPRSLKFPSSIEVAEVTAFFPDAAALAPRPRYPQIVDVLDSAQKRIGSAIRTAPSGDSLVGYQGPTDTLVVMDADDVVSRIVVRRSFDNEPYVGYVRDDEYFAELLAGWTLESLSSLNLAEAQIEGVSGATMTSMAMMESIPLATRDALQPTATGSASLSATPSARVHWRFQARDWGTVAVLCGAIVVAFGRSRGNRWVRFGFQLILVAYLGFLNGDMLSQAQLVGWARSGVPWRFAPGLTLLTIASFVVPVLSKRQLYCQHICPFGAAQHVAHPGAKRISLRWGGRVLKAAPFLLFSFAVLVGLFGWPVELASIEPFDAFLFGAAGSIVIALVGLAASFRIPMAYCRYGCPTGALLEYVRFRARADRLDWRDAITALLLATGLVALWFGNGA